MLGFVILLSVVMRTEVKFYKIKHIEMLQASSLQDVHITILASNIAIFRTQTQMHTILVHYGLYNSSLMSLSIISTRHQ